MSPILHAHGYDGDRLQASLVRILAANTLCSMATRGQSGVVHINTAFFCFSSDLRLYFLSHPESVHCHNLRHVPQVALAVFDSHQPWGEAHTGLQLFGTASLTPWELTGQARSLYAARFPRYTEFLRGAVGGQPTSSSLRALQFYHFVPERVQILDEWEFGDEVFITATILPEGPGAG